ncbi:helix-turn-helix domain-containing protein [Sphingoaurantiacus capsulatus]
MASFEGSTLPPVERLKAFAQLTPGYDPVLPEGAAVEEFQVRCRAWLLEDLVLTANNVTAVELHRTEAHVQNYNRDTYTIILLQRGSWSAELDYGTIRVGSGQLCIMDFNSPWLVKGTAQDNIMLVVPRSVVHAAVPDAPRLHGRTLDGAAGRLFAEHLLAVTRHLPEMSERDVSLVRNATMALLTSAIAALPSERPQVVTTSVRAAPITAIRAFIDQNLTLPTLDASLICERFAVTRPTLYRAFKEAGGVGAYIQSRRLEAVHAQLADSDDKRPLAEIADEYCFSSPAHFSTAFRRRYGYAPRDMRTGGVHIDAGALFHFYQKTLGSD